MAAIYKFAPKTFSWAAQYGNLFVVTGLAVLTAAYFVCYDEHSYSASVFGFSIVAIGYGMLVWGAISPTSILFKWKSKTTTFIATISYSLYLLHKGVIHVTQSAIGGLRIDPDSNLMLLISIATCILCAWLLNIVIEKPFMRLRKKIVLSAKEHNLQRL